MLTTTEQSKFQVERHYPISVCEHLARAITFSPLLSTSNISSEFKCNLCDAEYVGYIPGHLHERVEAHTRKSSSIYKHYNLQHNSEVPERFIEQFHITTKCRGKLDCLVKEMLYIRMRKP